MGRWLSVDPLAKKFPWQSPYVSMDNKPIIKIDPTGMATEDWFKNLKTGEVKEDKAVSGNKGDEVSLYGSSDTWKNLGKTEKEPEVQRAKMDFNMTHHSSTYPWATGRVEQDYTFDGGAVAGVVVKNVLKPIVGPVLDYLGSKIATKEGPNYLALFRPKDEFDAVKTLYRGTTGSESTSPILFLTDDAAVAATYVKNGGRVMSYDVTEYSLLKLEQEGILTKFMGKHLGTGITNTEYKFLGKDVVNALNTLAK